MKRQNPKSRKSGTASKRGTAQSSTVDSQKGADRTASLIENGYDDGEGGDKAAWIRVSTKMGTSLLRRYARGVDYDHDCDACRRGRCWQRLVVDPATGEGTLAHNAVGELS